MTQTTVFPTKHGDVLVDAADAHLVRRVPYVIHATYSRYVAVWIEGKKCRLSRLITGAERGMVVDHINGNQLDNRRANLRICTMQQNNWNRRRRLNGTSRFKGVSVNDGYWVATIAPNGKQRHLGTFPTEEEAALAYDEAAREAYGEFACLNFPKDGERSALFHEVDNG